VLSDAVCAGGRGALPIDERGFLAGFQGEDAGRQRLINADVEVDADLVFGGAEVENLLQAHGPFGVNPHGDFGEILANCRVFGNHLQHFGLHAVERLGAKIFDLPLLLQVFSAGAEAEHEPALILAGLGECGELIDHRFIELDGSVGVGVNLGRRLAVELADVGSHLEDSRLALVVDGSLLHIVFMDGVGFNGIELEVGLRGAEVGGGGIQTAQHLVLLLFARSGGCG